MYVAATFLGGLLAGLFHIAFLTPAHLRSQLVQVQEQVKRQRVRHIVAKGKTEEVNSNIAINISIGNMNAQRFDSMDEDAENPTGVQFYVIDPQNLAKV